MQCIRLRPSGSDQDSKDRGVRSGALRRGNDLNEITTASEFSPETYESPVRRVLEGTVYSERTSLSLPR